MKVPQEKGRLMSGPGWILSVFLLLWAGMAAYSISKAAAPILLPDEFGYWSHAAAMTGRDWGEVASQYPWYSFGYGMLMAPFMAVIGQPILLYRVMVFLNFGLLGLMCVLVYRLLSMILPEIDKKAAAFAAGVTLFFPSYLAYAQTTMAEALLIFLFSLLAFLMYRWFEKPSLLRGILVFLTVGYMYFVHMRTVGILLATALVMGAEGFYRTKKKKKVIGVAGVILAAALFLCLGHFGKEFFTGAASSPEQLQGNYYGAQWEKIGALFSLQGLGCFAASLGGKVFYLGCASFGLYFWGMGFLARECKKLICRSKEQPGRGAGQWLFLWLLMAHLAALLISAVYNMETDRLDGLLYGRYHENTICIICALGILELFSNPAVKKRLYWLCGLLCGCFFLVYALLGTGEIQYLNVHSVLGIYYAAVLAGYLGRRTVLYAYLAGMAGGTLLLGTAFLGRTPRRRFLVIAVVPILWIPVACMAASPGLYTGRTLSDSVLMLEKLRKETKQRGISEVFFLQDEGSKTDCIAQYMLPDVKVHPVTVEEAKGWESVPGIVLFWTGNGEAVKWSQGKPMFMRSSLYEVYDIE